MKEEVRLTSVKIKEGLRKDFKKTCLETDINLQNQIKRKITEIYEGKCSRT